VLDCFEVEWTELARDVVYRAFVSVFDFQDLILER
jgi:hypothetical protein